MTARGKTVLAVGLVLLTLGLVLGGVAFALGSTPATQPTDGGADGGADTGTTATSGPQTGGDGATDTSPTATATSAPGQETTDTTTTPGVTDETGGTSDTGSSGSTPSTVTPTTTATPDQLEARLDSAAASVGFTVLGTTDTDWRLVSVDSRTTANGPYVATSYQRGTAYFSTSQERATPFPPVPNTVAVMVHGGQGDLLDMGHVVVIRWVEGGTNIIFSTNLPSAEALAQAEALRPVR